MFVQTQYQHVILDDKQVPTIIGTTMKVIELVLDNQAYDWSPEDMQFQHPCLTKLWGMGYFAFGETAVAAGADYLRDYYAFTGPFAERIVQGLLTTPQAIAQFVHGYADAGCDNLILFPVTADLAQLDQLADVIA